MLYPTIWKSLVILMVLLSAQPALMQEESPRGLEVLSVDNAEALTELARFGNGIFTEKGAWSPDGTTLVIGGSIGLWFYDMTDQQAPPRLVDLDGAVFNVLFLHGGRYLAYTTSTGTHVIDVDTDAELMHLPHTYNIAAHPNDDYLLVRHSISLSNQDYPPGTGVLPVLELWDVVDQTLVQTFSPPEYMTQYYGLYILDLAISPDGRYFAGSYATPSEDTCGHHSGFVVVWDSTALDSEPFVLRGAEYVLFSPDSQTLLSKEWNSGGPDIARLHILDLITYETEIMDTLPAEEDWGYVDWFGFDPQSKELMAVTNGVLRFWDFSERMKIDEIELNSDIREIVFDQTGRAVGVAQDSLTVWDNDYQNAQERALDTPLLSAQFLEVGDGLSQIDVNGRLHLWRIDDPLELEEVFVSDPITDTDHLPILSLDGAFLAFRQDDLINVVSTADNRIVSQIENATFPLAFSADAGRLTLQRVEQLDDDDGTLNYVQVWDLAAQTLVREFGPYEQTSTINDLIATQLNPDGSWIGIVQRTDFQRSRYSVYAVESGEELYHYNVEYGQAAWTPDLRTLLVAEGGIGSSDTWLVRPFEADPESEPIHYSMDGYFSMISQVANRYFFITSSHTGCGGDMRELYVRDLSDMSLKWKKGLPMGYRGYATDGQFSHAGTLVYSVNKVFDAETGTLLAELPYRDYEAVTFGPEDRYILTLQDGIVRLWGVPSAGE